MKTSELIKQVEAMGLSVVDIGYSIGIENNIGETVAVVTTSEMFGIDTRYLNFGKLTDEQKTKLFRLLTEYAETPIEEREPEKRYRFRFPGIDDELSYLKYNTKDEYFSVGKPFKNSMFKITFTQPEIDHFPEDIKRLITVAERIEVAE